MCIRDSPFVGKMSFIKTISGKVATDSQLIDMRTGNLERIGKTVMMRGIYPNSVAMLVPDLSHLTKEGTDF